MMPYYFYPEFDMVSIRTKDIFEQEVEMDSATKMTKLMTDRDCFKKEMNFRNNINTNFGPVVFWIVKDTTINAVLCLLWIFVLIINVMFYIDADLNSYSKQQIRSEYQYYAIIAFSLLTIILSAFFGFVYVMFRWTLDASIVLSANQAKLDGSIGTQKYCKRLYVAFAVILQIMWNKFTIMYLLYFLLPLFGLQVFLKTYDNASGEELGNKNGLQCYSLLL